MLSVLNSKLHAFAVVCGRFSKLYSFLKNSYKNSIRASNRLDPSSLLRLSAGDKIHRSWLARIELHDVARI